MFRNKTNRQGLSMLLVLCLSFLLSTGPAWAHDGNVLPASDHPHGYSLEKMAKLMANFDASQNNKDYYPKTPFQILYADFSKPNGENTFTVRTDTEFFVPVLSVNDSPPIYGDFPKHDKQVGTYVFSKEQLGGHDFTITVDRHTTKLGPDYVAGPVEVKGLLGGGSHAIQLGAFLTPLPRGKHTVALSGHLNGAALGGDKVDFAFTYTVIVK